MKPIALLKSIAVAGSLLIATQLCFSQAHSQGSPAGVDAVLAKLLGDVKAFSSKCETRMLDGSQTETMSMTMDFALLDGKMRAEVDMTQMKSKDMRPEAIAMIKQMGMDRIVSITRPDKKNQTQIYPGLKSSVTTPLPQAQLDMIEKEPKVRKTELGKETIDGHACLKHKVVVTDSKGKAYESIVWNATDLKSFPVKIQSTEDSTTVVMQFKQIQLTKPDAAKFEVPTDYKQYDNMQDFQQVVMSRMAGGASGGPQPPVGN